MKKVFVGGGGGREHVLGWKLSQSDYFETVFYVPGNAGTSEGKCRNLSLKGNGANHPELFRSVESLGIDMVVVGPEAPLADGIVNFFNP